MNQLTNQFLHSVQGWFGKRDLPAEPEQESNLDKIRRAMLEALGDEGCESFPEIERRILFAADTHALWYLRPNLMAALSSLKGERGAYDKLREITSRFDGHLPHSMTVAVRAGAIGR